MYLGLDIGTSSVKAVLIDDKQNDRRQPHRAARRVAAPCRLVGAGRRELVDRLRAGRSTRCAKDHPKAVAAVKGIGLSGHMHGATLLDEGRRCSVPASCGMTVARRRNAAELEARCPVAATIAGNIALPGFTAPKLVWVKKHEPEVFAKVAKVLLPKDYVRLRLTGDYASDMSDSAGTFWLDVARRDWSRRAPRRHRVSPRPDAEALRGHRGDRPAARRARASAGAWRPAPVVAGGGGDNAASACGIGAVTPGAAFVSLGTSGVLFVSNARFSPQSGGAVHAFCHAVPNTWHQMGVILSAAASLEWLAGRSRNRCRRPDRALSGDKRAGPSPVTLPALSLAANARRTTTPRSAALLGARPCDRCGQRSPMPCSMASLSPSATVSKCSDGAGSDSRRVRLAVGGGSRSRTVAHASSPTLLDIAHRCSERGRFRRRLWRGAPRP